MDQSSQEIELDQAIDQMLQMGADPQARSSNLGSQASELRKALDAAAILRDFSDAASMRAGFLGTSRDRVLARIRGDRVTRGFWPRLLAWKLPVFNRRLTMPAIIMMLILSLLGGGGVAYAAQGTLPGDFLYPVKRSLESARVSLVAEDADEAALLAELASERLDEARELARQGRFHDLATALEAYHRTAAQLEALLQVLPADELAMVLALIERWTSNHSRILEEIAREIEGANMAETHPVQEGVRAARSRIRQVRAWVAEAGQEIFSVWPPPSTAMPMATPTQTSTVVVQTPTPRNPDRTPTAILLTQTSIPATLTSVAPTVTGIPATLTAVAPTLTAFAPTLTAILPTLTDLPPEITVTFVPPQPTDPGMELTLTAIAPTVSAVAPTLTAIAPTITAVVTPPGQGLPHIPPIPPIATFIPPLASTPIP